MTSVVLQGDCREVLAGLPEQSVQCVVTSPPYWGLRDYGSWFMQTIWGPIESFTPPRKNRHRWLVRIKWRASERNGGIKSPDGKCWIGALGLEDTLDRFVANQVEVFLAVRRVLRDDGTLWLNMGDAYAHLSSGGGGAVDVRTDGRTTTPGDKVRGRMASVNSVSGGIQPKNLLGQPWRLAFALQASGWYLRSDIIWHKPNPMPESVTDRPTKSHEYMFLMTKQPRYFYDADAVREPHTTLGPNIQEHKWNETSRHKVGDDPTFRTRPGSRPPNYIGHALGRNLRTVWTIPTQPFAKAHFATFPERLPELCIKAGTSEKGCCPECGAGWVRLVEKERRPTRPGLNCKQERKMDSADASWHPAANRDNQRHMTDVRTVGWGAGCEGCTFPGAVIPCTVLDPYAGSGTTGVGAKALGRSFIGIELNPEYCEMARERIRNPWPLPAIPDVAGQLSLLDGAECCA